MRNTFDHKTLYSEKFEACCKPQLNGTKREGRIMKITKSQHIEKLKASNVRNVSQESLKPDSLREIAELESEEAGKRSLREFGSEWLKSSAVLGQVNTELLAKALGR